jgi:hypothetical protein
MMFAQMFSPLRFLLSFIEQCQPKLGRLMATGLVTLAIALSLSVFSGMPMAIAGMKDDHFDGNIYALYGGNGSLVPPKVTLSDALKNTEKSVLLVFYVDDSRDSKQYASVVSQLQSFYGRVTDILPIMVDSMPIKDTYSPTEPGYYYDGFVPQTVVLDQSGKVIFNANGQVPFIQVDNVFRKLYELPIRSDSEDLKQRQVNEFNTELAL